MQESNHHGRFLCLVKNDTVGWNTVPPAAWLSFAVHRAAVITSVIARVMIGWVLCFMHDHPVDHIRSHPCAGYFAHPYPIEQADTRNSQHSHLSTIFAKLDVATRAEAVAVARERQVL